MSAFDDVSFAIENFSGKARLFPLPNLVLFPHVMQPLHVFEPRYRDLLEEALSDDQLIAMSVLAPGWEKNYEGRPRLYPMACLGRIIAYCRLADGTYNVLLLGMERVRLLREVASPKRFRMAEVEVCKDEYNAYPRAQRRLVRQKFRDALVNILPVLPEVREQLDHLLGNDVPLGVLTDLLAYLLEMDLSHKQALLAEVDVFRRADMLLSHIRGCEECSTAADSRGGFPPDFSMN